MIKQQILDEIRNIDNQLRIVSERDLWDVMEDRVQRLEHRRDQLQYELAKY